MRLKVERRWPKATYTIGRLYIDGLYYCNTLEDTDRGLNKFMREDEIVQKKVYGETAIPKGTYVIDMDTVSPKYAAVKFFADLTIDSPHSPRSATWANTPRRTDGPKLLSIDTTATTRGMRCEYCGSAPPKDVIFYVDQ